MGIRHAWARALALLCAVLLVLPAALAEDETATGTDLVQVTTEDGSFPELNADGFLDGQEFVYINKDEGIWRYCSDTLKVEIIRYTQTTSPKEIWYEAEVWSRDGDIFHMIPWADEGYEDSKWYSKQNYPYKICRKTGTVLAINSDFAFLRIKQKARVGILMRAGKILSERTKGKNKGTFPNLDTLALYPDGDMEVYWSDEMTAQEYVDLGAYEVLAFGPWLIRDGELNTTALKKYGTTRQPRTAIGMVEPGHYFCMLVEGRHSGSKGGSIAFLAEKLLDKGCQVAFNLDGGQSGCMVFMGEQINTMGKTTSSNARKTAELLGIGTSSLVPALEE